MGYNDNERYETKAREIEGVINVLGLNDEKLARTMANYMHRTNQQAFTRLAIEWLRVCGSPDYRFDGRNEASAKVGQALANKLDNIYLPLI